MKVFAKLTIALFLLGVSSLSAINDSGKMKSAVKEENITFVADGATLSGFVAYDSDVKGRRPAVLVVPEWWGLNDYVKNRARQLASLGYIAMAIDMYGNGKVAADPKEAQELTGPFYKNPQLGKIRLDAAIKRIKEYPQSDAAQVAAIGYCFGGTVVLNSAKLGANLKGVVSFHGGLAGVPASKNLLRAKLLVCHGGNDKFVTQHDLDIFRHQMDSIGASYTVKVYANATHAFTNPDATAIGKKYNMPIEYNAEADKNSWNDMKAFFGGLFK
jgi:dienelactone hydrolase